MIFTLKWFPKVWFYKRRSAGTSWKMSIRFSHTSFAKSYGWQCLFTSRPPVDLPSLHFGRYSLQHKRCRSRVLFICFSHLFWGTPSLDTHFNIITIGLMKRKKCFSHLFALGVPVNTHFNRRCGIGWPRNVGFSHLFALGVPVNTHFN